MQRSRLSRKLEQQSKKNLFFSLLGIIALFFILIKFDIPLLVNFSGFISNPKNSLEKKENAEIFIPPPVLDSLPQATGSAKIIISGFALEKQEIELFINNDLIDKTSVGKDGTFSFLEDISTGENTIKTRAVVKDKKSEFSKPLIITLRNKTPSLDINSPTEGQAFAKEQNLIDVIGNTDPDVKVTVNGFRAIIDSNGRFTYKLTLKSGENNIKIVGEDDAGNKAEKEIKVTLSQ